MGDQVAGNEEVVTAEENLGHDITLVAVEFEVVFGSEVVEAIDPGFVIVKAAVAVPVYDIVTVLNKFKGHIPARFDHETRFLRLEETHK